MAEPGLELKGPEAPSFFFFLVLYFSAPEGKIYIFQELKAGIWNFEPPQAVIKEEASLTSKTRLHSSGCWGSKKLGVSRDLPSGKGL